MYIKEHGTSSFIRDNSNGKIKVNQTYLSPNTLNFTLPGCREDILIIKTLLSKSNKHENSKKKNECITLHPLIDLRILIHKN